jgi:hypothetical protein
MWTPWRDRTGFPKSVAILATILIVSLGMCGLNLAASTKLMDSFGQVLFPLAILEAAVIVLSAAGLVVALSAWAVTAMVIHFRRADREIQQLLEPEQPDRPKEEKGRDGEES